MSKDKGMIIRKGNCGVIPTYLVWLLLGNSIPVCLFTFGNIYFLGSVLRYMYKGAISPILSKRLLNKTNISYLKGAGFFSYTLFNEACARQQVSLS